MKAATLRLYYRRYVLDISIHAAREGGDINRNRVVPCRKISIHAAREGGDDLRTYTGRDGTEISIHAAREDGDRLGTH